MITVHSIVKDEPFVYYAIKSVYREVDKILLWDTGTTDPSSKESLEQILKEDIEEKIDFRVFEIESKIGHDWDIYNFGSKIAENKGKFGVSHLRQKQIDETTSEYFLILDGDEIWYEGALTSALQDDRMQDPSWSCGFVPNVWYAKPEVIFKYDLYGRIFRTEKVIMDGAEFPNEMHIEKATRQPMVLGTNSIAFDGIKPYAHYEKMLKPKRRPDPVFTFPNPLGLPEVIINNLSFYERFK